MGKKSSKSTNEPWKKAQPYILGGAQSLNNAYQQNAGNIQDATNQVTGLLPSIIEKYQQGNPNINAATDYNTSVLGGQYLGEGNPYLQQIINQSVGDSTNATQAALGLRGLTGGSSYADIISKNAGNLAAGLRYGDYNNERGRMATAAGQAPSLAAGEYLGINPALQVAGASMMPVSAASQYAGSLGGLLGGYGTQSSRPSTASSIADGVGTALSLAALFSDERLKQDVRKVGKTKGGLDVFTYRYVGDPATHMGVMAQQVDKKQPKASGPTVGGFRTVNYAEVR